MNPCIPEGAEMDVLDGASHWLSSRALLLIEVHKKDTSTKSRVGWSGRLAQLIE